MKRNEGKQKNLYKLISYNKNFSEKWGVDK